ncbi:MAG: hypothetical protein P4M00_06115 [Azospirillaceae bacterium]|nr:hypothetical protein [Azospirillaceae bacterium]
MTAARQSPFRAAEAAFNRLNAEQQRIAAALFRRLSERTPGGRDIGHPTRADELAEIAGVTLAELAAVADLFRTPGCALLVPATPKPITADGVLDLSDPGLIHHWPRLAAWVEDEQELAQTYRLLEQNATLWHQGRMDLWGTLNLALARDWYERAHPTAAWARRYGGNFALVLKFLEASASGRSRVQHRRRRQNRRSRVIAIGVIAMAALLGVLSGIAVIAHNQARNRETAASQHMAEAKQQQQRALDLQRDAQNQQKIAADQQAQAQRAQQIAGDARDAAEAQLNETVTGLHDKLKVIGRLDLLDSIAQRAQAYFDAHPPGPTEWNSLHSQGVALDNRGDVLFAQGNLAGALTTARAALAIGARLTVHDPDNTDWQAELAARQRALGLMLKAQGDHAGATAAFQQERTLALALVARAPDNAKARDALAEADKNDGDMHLLSGDLAGALASFQEELRISERLVAADPADARWQRDLAVAHDKIGEVLQDQGELTGALAAFQHFRAISERLATLDPADVNRQRDLAIAHEKVGTVLQTQGDLPGALQEFEQYRTIIARLTMLDPGNAGWKRDLALSHQWVGHVLDGQGDLPGALEAYHQAEAIQQRLVNQDTTNADWHADLAYSQSRIAEIAAKGATPAGLP